MNNKSVLIIGGGIIGACCASRLCEAGLDVTLMEPREPGVSASFGNAGHLAIEQSEPLASFEQIANFPRRLFTFGGPLDLPLKSIMQWSLFSGRFIMASMPAAHRRGKQTLTALLSEAMPAWRDIARMAGATDLIGEKGHFVAWESASSAVKRRANWSRNTSPGAAFHPASSLDLEQLRELVDAPIEDAAHFTQTGQIYDLREMHEAILKSAALAGMRILRRSACRVEIENRCAHVFCTAGSKHSADTVLIAAGVGSRSLLESAGHKVPLIAERGYHIEFDDNVWPEDFPPVVFEDRSLIITKFRKQLRLASFVEFAAAQAPPDKRKWRRLYDHAKDLGIPVEEPVAEWMGARPTLPDYLPAIGRSRRADNLCYAFGHQHLGLTLAPLTAHLIADLVSTGVAAPILKNLDIDRFV